MISKYGVLLFLVELTYISAQPQPSNIGVVPQGLNDDTTTLRVGPGTLGKSVASAVHDEYTTHCAKWLSSSYTQLAWFSKSSFCAKTIMQPQYERTVSWKMTTGIHDIKMNINTILNRVRTGLYENILLYGPLIYLVYSIIRTILPLMRMQTENMTERTALTCVSTEAQTTMVPFEMLIQFSAFVAVVCTQFAAQSRRLGDARTAKRYYQIAIQLHKGIQQALLHTT